MTHAEGLILVAYLAAAFPQRDVPDETAELYAQHLERYTPEAGRRAVERLIAEQPYFPAIAVVREYCGYEDRNAERSALPAGDDFAPADEEFVKKILGEFWGEGPEGVRRRFEARKNAGTLRPEEREQLAREYAAAMPELDKIREREEAEAYARFAELKRMPRHPHAHPCTGELADWVGKHLVCRKCGECHGPNCTRADHPRSVTA